MAAMATTMKNGRYGTKAFRKPAVLAKMPVAPTPTPSAANTTGPIQQRDAKKAAMIPPRDAIETGSVALFEPSLSWDEEASEIFMASVFGILFIGFSHLLFIGWMCFP